MSETCAQKGHARALDSYCPAESHGGPPARQQYDQRDRLTVISEEDTVSDNGGARAPVTGRLIHDVCLPFARNDASPMRFCGYLMDSSCHADTLQP
eukprot:1153231-Pelagomonas_calceolata.AAC.7